MRAERKKEKKMRDQLLSDGTMDGTWGRAVDVSRMRKEVCRIRT